VVINQVKGFEAFMRGIDLRKLNEERFSGKRHHQLMAEHRDRVAAYEQAVIMTNFTGTLNDIGEVWREKERIRREKIKATKEAKLYDFPDELLQIALRSLDARGAV
jgi:hypothetical protein